jgi:AcrR family transcriptional regulator
MAQRRRPQRPKRLSREEKKAQTRALLLGAAEEVFAERGFFAASVEEVAERAGFSMGAVYSNFESKADLFLALFEEHVAVQLHDYLELFEAAGTLEEQARGGADRWMRYLREHPDYFPLYLEFAAYAARDPRMREGFAAGQAAFRRSFTAMVQQAAEDVGIEPPPGAAGQFGLLVSALGNGLALEKLADPDGVPDELFGSLLAVIFQALADWSRTAGAGEAAETTAPAAKEATRRRVK